jgi:hypothetical protein
MRKFWQSMILILATLYLTGCQPSGMSASLETVAQPVAEESSVSAPEDKGPAAESLSETQTVGDECIRCHSDKARLIDTAEPEEEDAEGESSGVG